MIIVWGKAYTLPGGKFAGLFLSSQLELATVCRHVITCSCFKYVVVQLDSCKSLCVLASLQVLSGAARGNTLGLCTMVTQFKYKEAQEGVVIYSKLFRHIGSFKSMGKLVDWVKKAVLAIFILSFTHVLWGRKYFIHGKPNGLLALHCTVCKSACNFCFDYLSSDVFAFAWGLQLNSAQ